MDKINLYAGQLEGEENERKEKASAEKLDKWRKDALDSTLDAVRKENSNSIKDALDI